MSVRRARCWSFVLLGVLLMLGHVCELPVESLAVVGHAEANGGHDHDGALHAGSCEAATTTASSLHVAAPPADVMPRSLDGVIVVADVLRDVTAATSPPSSPPLFLLHAALLI